MLELFERSTYIQAVEDIITFFLWGLFEDLQVLKDLLMNKNLVIKSNAIFTKKIEDDSIRGFECDMLELQGATTDGFGLVFGIFFITSTKGELVDEVDSRCSLTISLLKS